jgi:dTMP kinase
MMRATAGRGLFITFEGVEGAGKTTQIALLRDALEAEGHRVTATRCPGGEPLAEAIRAVLLDADSLVLPPTELLLFCAARVQVTARVLRPLLDAGHVVLMDRFTDSTVAYQGHARGQDLETVRSLNRFATGGLCPDLTLLLDVDPERGLARQTDRNRMEAESLEFHRRVRQGYLAEAALDPDRFRVVDGSLPIDAIHQTLLACARPLLASRS